MTLRVILNNLFPSRYQVSIKNITAEGEVLVRIYPAAYWEPLQVRKNQTLYVEESTSVVISKDILEVGEVNMMNFELIEHYQNLP